MGQPVANAPGRSRRYLDRAQSYGRAAAALAARGVGRDVQAPYFMLVAHAVELALKAVVAGGNHDEDQLMLIGHDLPLCLRWATDLGLELTTADEEIEAVVATLAMPHLAQTLRYPAYLSWPLPRPDEALDALSRLLARVEGLVARPPSPTAH